MNIKMIIALVLVLGMIVLGFLSFTGSIALAAGPEESLILTKSQQKPQYSASDVISTVDGSVIGSSKLIRKDEGIKANLIADSLEPGAYSFWWIITNNPGGADEQRSVLWAAGQVVKANGKINIKARLNVGETPGMVLSGNGLTNPFGAKVELLAKYHGPASDNPDDLEQQLTTPNFGCEDSCPNSLRATHEPAQ